MGKEVKRKISQLIMVWLLPFILIGGVIWPVIGYLVLGMIVFFSVLSFFRKRYWCWYLCPRGAFLELVMPYFSLKIPAPKVFSRPWFKWTVFVVLIGYLLYLIIRSGGNIFVIGSAFVSMCILTTTFAVILGTATKPRSWCMICPMGTLQETIGKIRS